MTAAPSPESPRRPGRPSIGPQVNVRIPPELRARIDAAALPGEALADTMRRLLDLAADLPPTALEDVAHALRVAAAHHARQASARREAGPARSDRRALLREAARDYEALAERLAQHAHANGGAPPLTVAEAFPNRARGAE
jgi:hypothetical protein